MEIIVNDRLCFGRDHLSPIKVWIASHDALYEFGDILIRRNSLGYRFALGPLGVLEIVFSGAIAYLGQVLCNTLIITTWKPPQ